MKIGTKSLLFGVHQVILHPICVTIAWKNLYGSWPKWWEAICILVHDWGYWGCSEMDGPEGEEHPRFGASVAFWIVWHVATITRRSTGYAAFAREFCEGHSRFYARKHLEGATSRLMAADKLGTVLLPWWIYLPMARATGELAEYRAESDRYWRETGKGIPSSISDREWYDWLQKYLCEVAARPMDANINTRT